MVRIPSQSYLFSSLVFPEKKCFIRSLALVLLMLVNTSLLPDIDRCTRLEGDEQHTRSVPRSIGTLDPLKVFLVTSVLWSFSIFLSSRIAMLLFFSHSAHFCYFSSLSAHYFRFRFLWRMARFHSEYDILYPRFTHSLTHSVYVARKLWLCYLEQVSPVLTATGFEWIGWSDLILNTFPVVFRLKRLINVWPCSTRINRFRFHGWIGRGLLSFVGKNCFRLIWLAELLNDEHQSSLPSGFQRISILIIVPNNDNNKHNRNKNNGGWSRINIAPIININF